MLEAMGLGFATSGVLYERTHRDGFPELARYLLGGLLVLACYALLYPGDREGLRRCALAFACAGVGVGLARIGDALR